MKFTWAEENYTLNSSEKDFRNETFCVQLF